MRFVISENAIDGLASINVDMTWFKKPALLPDNPNVKVRFFDGICVVYTERCDAQQSLLVIAPAEGSLFEQIPPDLNRSVYDRCARIALRAFGRKITLNPRWMPFHAGNRVSIFAFGVGHKERLLAEVNTLNSSNVFIFGFGRQPEHFELGEIKPDYLVYNKALLAFQEALKSIEANNDIGIDGLVDLTTEPLAGMAKGFSFEEWYPKLLTKDQLRFVDHKLVGPLRLRGAAGTGKTLAMALKALKTKYDADNLGTPVRILFITHSWAMAEHVDQLLSDMDVSPESISTIDVFPLLLVANSRNYGDIGREPLGIDSQQGKLLALREISQVLQKFRQSDWLAYRSGCTKEFVDRVEADQDSKGHKLFCWDVLVEFGCVIAAQGILTHVSDKERYLRVRRMKWMLSLDNRTEKEAIFALWKEFMQNLRVKGFISTDQIMSDYLNDLSTFYWEAARKKQGYDIVFVDEMHLFNSQERLIFHNLLNDGDVPPKVVMALDPNQSPRETFTNVIDADSSESETIFTRARLSQPDKIDLIDVFRYTPQIAQVISMVNEAAPALDLLEEWDVPRGVSAIGSGSAPRYYIAENRLETFRYSTELALARAKAAATRNGHVAILCMDDERFEIYRHAASGQLEKSALVISSRDDTERLKYLGKRIVLSTPEYVAGLQFDTVILVDVNRSQVPEGKNSSFHLRRFLSELYLGMSRAQQELFLVSSKDEGGLPVMLEKAKEMEVIIPA